jgi:alkylation response protein AidB-like acyl-CoA dehydrogenase
MVFETAAEIRACRHIALDAAAQLDTGDPARVEIGMIKVLTARMFHNAVDRAIQVHGGMGVTGDLPLQRFYKEARLGRIWDGPDETHIATVSRLLLKPYRDAYAREQDAAR